MGESQVTEKKFNKKKLIKPFICLVVVIVGVVIFFIYRDNKLERMERFNHKFERYLGLGNGTKESEVYWNKVVTDKTVTSRVRLMVSVSYYNYYAKEAITVDDILTDYQYFCDGKRKTFYDDLYLFTLFMSQCEKILPKNIKADCLGYENVINVLEENVLSYYGIEDAGSEAASNLTQEQVDEICYTFIRSDMEYEMLEKLYIFVALDVAKSQYDTAYDISQGYEYMLFDTDFDETRIEINDVGEKVIYGEDRAVCYYLDFGNVDLCSDEEEWYIYKIEEVKASSVDGICPGKVGDFREDVEFSEDIPYYNVIKLPDRTIYYVGAVSVIIDFEDNIATKISFEIYNHPE